jgi:hypothetical protein
MQGEEVFLAVLTIIGERLDFQERLLAKRIER